MNISFTGKTFRSVGDLFFQAIVDGKAVSCFVTSEALSLCDCAHQKATAEEVYRNYRDWIEQAAVSYTHLTLPTIVEWCRSRWSPYH